MLGGRNETLPIALEFGTDGAGASTEEVVADDPVALIFEHALVERFDVASVSGCEGRCRTWLGVGLVGWRSMAEGGSFDDISINCRLSHVVW